MVLKIKKPLESWWIARTFTYMYRMWWLDYLMESFMMMFQPGFASWIGWFCRNTSVSLYHPNLWRNAEKRYSSPTFHHFSISDLRQLVWSPRIFGKFEDETLRYTADAMERLGEENQQPTAPETRLFPVRVFWSATCREWGFYKWSTVPFC